MPLPVLILIICAITIPLIVGVVLIVRNAIRVRRESKTTTNSLDTEPTGLEDLESQKSVTASGGSSNSPKKLKEIVLETYRSNRRTSTGRKSRVSVDPAPGSRPPLPPNTRIVKYKQSKPKPLSIDDNGNIV